MFKSLKIILLLIVGAVLVILLAGMLKFNVIQDDVYIEQPEETVVEGNIIEQEEEEAPSASIPNINHDLTTNAWVWQKSQYNNDTEITPTNPADFVAQFTTDNGFSSTTDCNNVMGSYTVDGGTLSFGPMATTLMACLDETYESQYAGMLAEVRSYFIDESGRLILEFQYDSGSMIFEPSS